MSEIEKIKYEAKLEMLEHVTERIKRYYNFIQGGTLAALVAYHVGEVAEDIKREMEREYGIED